MACTERCRWAGHGLLRRQGVHGRWGERFCLATGVSRVAARAGLGHCQGAASLGAGAPEGPGHGHAMQFGRPHPGLSKVPRCPRRMRLGRAQTIRPFWLQKSARVASSTTQENSAPRSISVEKRESALITRRGTSARTGWAPRRPTQGTPASRSTAGAYRPWKLRLQAPGTHNCIMNSCKLTGLTPFPRRDSGWAWTCRRVALARSVLPVERSPWYET